MLYHVVSCCIYRLDLRLIQRCHGRGVYHAVEAVKHRVVICAILARNHVMLGDIFFVDLFFFQVRVLMLPWKTRETGTISDLLKTVGAQTL